MSAKYNEHPMESKFREDLAAVRIERERIEVCYRSWLEQMDLQHVEDIQMAFRGGYAQGKYDAKLVPQPPTGPQGEK